jgi:Mg/Co/Ni transporter MgtE
MTKNPVTVAADDDCTIAANAFREYRLKTLPVVENKANRKLAGCIRVRRLLAFVLKEMGANGTTDGNVETGDRKQEAGARP